MPLLLAFLWASRAWAGLADLSPLSSTEPVAARGPTIPGGTWQFGIQDGDAAGGSIGGITLVNFGTAGAAALGRMTWSLRCGELAAGPFPLTYAGMYMEDYGTFPAWTWVGRTPDLGGCGWEGRLTVEALLAPEAPAGETIRLGFPINAIEDPVWWGSIRDTTGATVPWDDAPGLAWTVTRTAGRTEVVATLPAEPPALLPVGDRRPRESLGPARAFADALLRHGVDRYGPRPTALWCGVLDAETLTVPVRGVPALPGWRGLDRAVGGTNLYHDAHALRAFGALSDLTGDDRYRAAAAAYARDFFAVAQSPGSGLLAWGEHLFYDVFADGVRENREHHEFLEFTPPWDVLWEADRVATARAIAGVRHHFRGADTFLYNRHANWKTGGWQAGGEPWIKHASLFAYSFAFLHARTGEAEWARSARGVADVYWNARHPKTGLTPSCLGDDRKQAKGAGLGQLLYIYWLMLAGREAPELAPLRERALTNLKDLDAALWDARAGSYRASVAVDGTPGKAGPARIWGTGYGDLGLLPAARSAAALARLEGDRTARRMALRLGQAARAARPTADVTLTAVALALNLFLDLDALDPKGGWRADAVRYANLGLDRFRRNDFFVRAAGDRYYEAKIGAGLFMTGLVRLHLRGLHRDEGRLVLL